MSLNLVETVEQFLVSHPEEKFTARRIAEWIFENHTEECRRKQKRSVAMVVPLDNDDALIQQIAAEIGSRRPRLQAKNPCIKITESRPRQYYFTEKTDREEVEKAENKKNQTGEHALYPLLVDFLWSEQNVRSKRIDEKSSKNSHGANGNYWLHPDIVGMENLAGDWHRDINDCVTHYAGKRARLWSFEVKMQINRSNVRKAFFQAVSNSSWANFGYLVATEIQGADTLKELRILSAAHGIGVIRLEAGNPSESEIEIPAKERSEIDWDTVNRLAKENKRFLEYVNLVTQFYQTQKVIEAKWDEPSGLN